MRLLARILVAALGMLPGAASGSEIQFENIGPRWTAHLIEPGSPEARITGNAAAILNLDETANGLQATVQVHTLALPATVNLGAAKKLWRETLIRPPLPPKFSVLKEATFQVNRQWQYIIAYREDTGLTPPSLLYTSAMATVVNGEIQLLTYSDHEPEFVKLAPAVRKLFKTVVLTVSNAK